MMKFCCARDLREMLGVSLYTINAMVKDGRLPRPISQKDLREEINQRYLPRKPLIRVTNGKKRLWRMEEIEKMIADGRLKKIS
jgi:hypothetical protein